MNHYQNPHSQMPYQGQPGYAAPQQGMYTRPGMQPGGYAPAPRPPQYQQPQEANIQVVNTPNGPMYLDVRTNQLLGPVQQQQQPTYYPGPPQVRTTAAVHAQQGIANQYVTNSRYGAPGTPYPQENTGGQDNRYGHIQQLTQPERNLPMTTPPTPVVMTPSVSAPALTIPPVHRRLPGVKEFPLRKQPVTNKEVYSSSDSVLGTSLCHVADALVQMAHEKKSDKLVWVQPGIILHNFYDTSVKDQEADLFQSNAEAAYKVFRQKLSQVDNRNNVAYYQAYNQWLTDQTNDYLTCTFTDGLRIDSFADDFADLLGVLGGPDTERLKGLLDYLNDVLSQATVDVAAARGNDETGEKAEDSPAVDEGVAVVPERVTLVYVKLLSTEIGDDGTLEGNKTASRIMANLEGFVEEQMFYLVTLDRRIYHVLYLPGNAVDIRYIEG